MSITNNCRFIGRLGHEPELEYTPGGTAKLRLRLAVNERKRIDEEWQYVTTWINLLSLGKNAESVSNIVRKGDLAAFDTHFEERSWEDEESGEMRRFYDFLVERWELLARSPNNTDEDDYSEEEERENEVEEESPSTLNF